MGKPESWKDILAKRQYKTTMSDHAWVLVSSARQAAVRRISSVSRYEADPDAPVVLHYKCRKCGTKASRIGAEWIFENKTLENLSCMENIIKDILE